MRKFVLDTSALVRLYLPDGPLPDGLEEAVDLASQAEAALLAPELLLVEVAQAIRKKERAGVILEPEGDAVLEAVLCLPLQLVSHRALLPDAVRLARQTNVTVYDALFLALSRMHGAELISADRLLLDAVNRC